MNTEITNALKATSDTAQYDNSAKRLLGNKYILAQILVYTVDEFKGMQPMDVVPLIEGEPKIGIVPVEPGLTNERQGDKIIGLNTENTEEKIRRLMKKYGLMCNIRKANPYRRMAKAIKTNNVADNLVKREFEKYGPRRILLTDITYVPFDGRFCYLSAIIDAFTKQILSYVLSESLEVDFVLETVNLMIEKHGVSLTTKTILHSDQGCHYTSCSFIQLVKDKGLRQSMSRRGNCWDNAPQESFFGRMKDHIGDRLKECGTYSEVRAIIDDWMDYYNNDRYQWELAKLSPNEYYKYITTGIYPIKGKIPSTDMYDEEGNKTN